MGRPCHVEPRTLYLNEIDPPSISRCKTNPIILMSNTERCYSTPQSASPEALPLGLRGGIPGPPLESDPAQIMKKVLVVGDEEEIGLIVKSGFSGTPSLEPRSC